MSTPAPVPLDALRQVGALLQAGELRGAHERLQAIVAAHPDCAEALRLLGGLRQAFGDIEGAEVLLRKALALEPGGAPTLATLGALLLAAGREEEGEARLRGGCRQHVHGRLIVCHGFPDSSRYRRIAQNSSFSSGNSPAMCMPMPPERSSCFQRSCAVSSSK